MLHGLEDRARELNRLAAENARAVADRAGRPVVVAGLGRTDRRPPRPARTLERGRGGRGLRRADRGPAAKAARTSSGSRPCRRPRKSARRRWPRRDVGMPYTVTASFDTAGRTMMGVAPAALGALVEGFDPEAARLWRQLRRRRLRSPGRDPRHERSRAGRAADRQGQRRRAALARRGDPLFRHAGTDGDLRRARGRLRRAHHRRLLRQHARPMSRRCGAASTPIEPAPRPNVETIVAALGPLVAPPAAEPARAARRRERA